MTLPDATRFYVDGAWYTPEGATLAPVINPATEKEIAKVALGTADDVNKAVAAAKEAFDGFASTTLKYRYDLLNEINEALIARNEELAIAIREEMGAPNGLARHAQAPSGTQHFGQILKELENYKFEEKRGSTTVRHEPIGVCALITPWNWPMNQIATKVAPAIAAGCTMVLKPSELAPLDAVIMADIIDKVGVPKGVFNLVHGDGVGVGAPLVEHKDIEMVSFTGSTRAGIAISKGAADRIKRVSLELGGKSAGIILEGADIAASVHNAVTDVMGNTGQSCNARTRVLVPRAHYSEAAEVAAAAAATVSTGMPDSDADMGPIANKNQYGRVVELINAGIKEGADLLAGGPDRPEGLDAGYFVPPTVFGGVTRDMIVAREEIFGPVVSLMAYDTVEEAIEIANESEYGLSGAVWAASREDAVEVASKLRTGMVHINGAGLDAAAPFGGYKMSGNGREWGKYGLEEFLEVKAVYGANG